MYNYHNDPLLLDQRAKKKVESKREDKRKEKFEESKWRSKAKCRGDLSEPNPTLKMNEEKKEFWFMNMKQKEEEERKERPLFENLEEQILQIKKIEENSVFSDSLEEIVNQFPEEEKQSRERRQKDGVFNKKRIQDDDRNLKEKKKKVKVYYHESFQIYENVNHCMDQSDSQTPTFPENPHLPVILPPHGQELDQIIFVQEVVPFERQSSTPSFQRVPSGETSNNKQTRVNKQKEHKSTISKRQEEEGQSSSGIGNMQNKVEMPNKNAKNQEVDEYEAFNKIQAKKSIEVAKDITVKEKQQQSKLLKNQPKQYKQALLTQQQSPKSLFNIKPQSNPSPVSSANPNNKSFYQQPLQSPHPLSSSPLRPTPPLNIEVCFSPNSEGYSKLLQEMVKTHSRYWPSTHQLKWITRYITPENSRLQGADIKPISMMGENEEISQMLAQQILHRQQKKRSNHRIYEIDSETPQSDNLTGVPYITSQKMNQFDWAQFNRRIEIRQITRKETLYREIADMSFGWVQNQTPPTGSNPQNFEAFLLQQKDDKSASECFSPCPPSQTSSAMIALDRAINCQQFPEYNSQRHLPSYRSIKFKEISKFYNC